MSFFYDNYESKGEPGSRSYKIYRIIYGTSTRSGKLFDVVLLWAIVLSVLLVMIESVQQVRLNFGGLLRTLEWIFTILFTAEYILRISLVKRPLRYMTSFYGLVDLISFLPSYLSFFLVGAHSLMVIRVFRLLRIFRILKLVRYLKEARTLGAALNASRQKITVFLMFVIFVTMIMGTLMYLIEDAGAGFTSIPRSIYWAIVTLTTVGYGDIAPQTWLGQFLAAFIMILGYAIIAVPTGIVSAEYMRGAKDTTSEIRHCPRCEQEIIDPEYLYCHRCGERLPPTIAT